jgi:hypothetical protein
LTEAEDDEDDSDIDREITMSGVETIEPPHTHYLSAAQGWTELGNLAEARKELGQIPAGLQEHPGVLEARWAICVEEKDWATALAIAEKHMGVAPESVAGWVHRAYAMRRAPGGGLQAAWDALFPVMEKFPEESIVPYNLACYACQLQQLDVARLMFSRALMVGGRNQVKQMALNDPDLQPLWEEFRAL